MKKYIIFCIGALLYGCGLAPTYNAPPPRASVHGGMEDMANMDHSHHSHDKAATHEDPFGGPYQSMGTDCGGWILCPASSPHGGYHTTFHDWNIGVHGGVNLVYTLQPGPRGKSGFAAANHLMAMADHALGGGTFRASLGMSFDALTESSFGKPQLLQTGEMRDGRENVDVQHPHPLITNLSATYTHPLSETSDWFCSAALVGDVAGVPMEYHRASAKRSVDVSLFHHGTTDKHITSSVLSCGLDYEKIRIAAAVFHGQEPGSNPYSIGLGSPDSFAVSFQYMPTRNWAFSAYYAYIHNAERAEPGDIKRFTAAAMYTMPLSDDDWWATTAIFTHDKKMRGDANMFVLDSTLKKGKNYFYGRIDVGEKEASLAGVNTFGRPGVEASEHDTGDAPHEEEHEKNFLIGAGTIGYARTLWEKNSLEVGVGADITGYVLPENLQQLYGSFPVSGNLYFFMDF